MKLLWVCSMLFAVIEQGRAVSSFAMPLILCWLSKYVPMPGDVSLDLCKQTPFLDLLQALKQHYELCR